MSFLFLLAAVGFALKFDADGLFLEQLRSGDPQAFRLLVERHHASLVGLAQTIVRNRAAAEDVAQETWLAVLGHVARFEGKAQLSTWIIAILLNKAKTHARREGRYTELSINDGEDVDGPTVPASRFDQTGHWADPPASFDGLSPERIFAGRQMWQHVRAVIDRLPPAQKAVFLMRDVEGLDAPETCHTLNLSAENQRILLHRARARIRTEIEHLVRGKTMDAITVT